MTSQEREVAPPLDTDKKLQDFAEIIQGNFRQLFEAYHLHGPRTSAPANADGVVGDIYITQVGSTWYLYAKVAADTWKRVALG